MRALPHWLVPAVRRHAILATLMTFLATTAVGLPATAAGDDGWTPRKPPISTPWTDQVGPGNALPDYPRPQLTRPRWQNLNGVWEYAPAESTEPPLGQQLRERILVPYPPESALSGIQRHDDHAWYRRTFDVPPDWHGQRVILHFGAVDQTAQVWVNGKRVTTHTGGYTEFSVDVTDALRPGGAQEIVVGVEDRNDGAAMPVGKQRNHPGGIFYTGSSGIWQTVWLEPVPAAHVDRVDVAPDPASRTFTVTPQTSGVTHERVEAVLSTPASDGGREVARATGDAGTSVRLPVENPRLWSPSDPYLYDLRIRLIGPDGQAVDEVGSYAGMRSISLVKDVHGRPRMALNGKILFQHGPLDQGYWPDGLYTAPTDDALRFDLQQAKDLGFNMVRKHAKIEPARWYYWADRLGLLVWQDMPSLPTRPEIKPPNPQPPSGPEAETHFRDELSAMIDQLRGFPSIVVWVPFNEGWGEFDTAGIADDVRRHDPTRLVDASSGVNCCFSLPDTGAGDLYDDHTYVGPGTPKVSSPRASVDGEYGGLGLVMRGHLWPGHPNSYEMTDSPEKLTRRYTETSELLTRTIRDNGLSAAVYTQFADVENEVNGLLTYDRRVLKPDQATVRQDNLRAIQAGSS